MSGRVRVTLKDGRRVIGYRKTERAIETRRRPHEMPDWRLSFIAPPELFVTPSIKTGVVGVSVLPPDMVEVRGKNRGWLFDQLFAFLREIEAGPFTVHAVLAREGNRPSKEVQEINYWPGRRMLWNGRPVA